MRRIYFLFILSVLYCNTVNAQGSQVKIANNSVGKLQTSISNKEDQKKQFTIIGEGLKAIESAQSDKKTKNWPETWAIKAYLTSYVALVDENEQSAEKNFSLAVEAVAKAKELDKFQSNHELIGAAEKNIIAKKQSLGTEAFNNNDFLNAYTLLKDVSDRYPKDTLLAVNTAICAQNIQQYNDALAFLLRAKEAGIKNPSVYQNIAAIYTSKFDNELAIKTLEEGLQLNPYHISLNNDYINLLLDNERYEKALKRIESSLGQDNQNKLLLFLYGYLQQYKQNNLSNAENAYKKALNLDQNYFDSLYQLALVFLSEANNSLNNKNVSKYNSFTNRAEFTLLRAYEINQNNRNVIKLLIDIYTRKNRLDRVQELKRKLNEF